MLVPVSHFYDQVKTFIEYPLVSLIYQRRLTLRSLQFPPRTHNDFHYENDLVDMYSSFVLRCECPSDSNWSPKLFTDLASYDDSKPIDS
jgi:hypothetical protein